MDNFYNLSFQSILQYPHRFIMMAMILRLSVNCLFLIIYTKTEKDRPVCCTRFFEIVRLKIQQNHVINTGGNYTDYKYKFITALDNVQNIS